MSQFFIRRAESQSGAEGPFSEQQIRELAARGKLKLEDEVSEDGDVWHSCQTMIRSAIECDASPATVKSPEQEESPPSIETNKGDSLADSDVYQIAVATPEEGVDKLKTDVSAAAPKKSKRRKKERKPKKQVLKKSDDLTNVKKYTPSGKCQKLWLFIPFLLGGATAAIGLTVITTLVGAVLGGIVGDFSGEFSGALSDTLDNRDRSGDSGTFDIKTVGALFGFYAGFVFGMAGGAIATSYWTTEFFNRFSHNRNRALAILLAAITCLLGCGAASILTSTLPGASGVVMTIIIGMAVVCPIIACIIADEMIRTNYYCEKCNSFFQPFAERRFSTRSKFLSLAESGDVVGLSRLKEVSEEEPAAFLVKLEKCGSRCSTRLLIRTGVYVELPSESDSEKKSLRRYEKDGFINPIDAKLWQKILTADDD